MIHSTSWGYDFCVQELYTMWCGRTWQKTLKARGFKPLERVCHIARRYNKEIHDRQVSYYDQFEDFFGSTSVLSRLFHVWMFVLSLLSRIQELTSTCIRFRSGTNTLGIIFFCLIFGTVLGSMGRKAYVVVQFFAIVEEVMMRMVSRVMW